MSVTDCLTESITNNEKKTLLYSKTIASGTSKKLPHCPGIRVGNADDTKHPCNIRIKE